MTTQAADEVLTLEQVAQLLQLPPSSVYELTRQRARSHHAHPTPVLKIARRLRFRKSAILAWLSDLEAGR